MELRLQLDADGAAALEELKTFTGAKTTSAALLTALGQYLALRRILAEEPNRALGLVDRTGDTWQELVLRDDGCDSVPNNVYHLPVRMQTDRALVQSLVDEACDAAVENGYIADMRLAPIVIANDLVLCCSTLEDEKPESLVPLVEDWQKRHP